MLVVGWQKDSGTDAAQFCQTSRHDRQNERKKQVSERRKRLKVYTMH